jgi:hypothetical protein
VIPFQVELAGDTATALIVQDIVPGRRRVGRPATAVATFVVILGSLACVLSVASVHLANAIIWPWSSASTGTSGPRPDRLLTSMAPSGVQRAAAPEFTAIAFLAGDRSAKPDGSSVQPQAGSGTESSVTPAVTGSPMAPVTEAVLPVASNGAAREQSLNAGPRSAAVAETKPALRAPVAVGGRLPSGETAPRLALSPGSSRMALAAAFPSDGRSGTQMEEARPIQISRHVGDSPPAAVALSSEMVTFLLGRGEIMLQQGDIRSARLYFEKAAEAGSGHGAVGAGKTYDPAFLATVTAPGLASDVARAIKWYRMASAASGDQYADERLKALAQQADR